MSFHNHGYYDSTNDRYTYIKYDTNKQAFEFKHFDNPSTPAYITKQIPEYIREFVKKEDCVRITVPYRWREYALADKLGITNFKDNVKSKQYIKEMVFLDPRLYGADSRIDDYMLQVYNKQNGEATYEGLSQSFLDIETDVLKCVGNDIQSRRYQPIYLSSCYNDKANKLTIDYLIDNCYANQAPIIKDPDGFIKRVKENLITELKNNEKLQHKDFDTIRPRIEEIFSNFNVVIRGHNDEKELIKANWQEVMRVDKPNFLQIYNADYDVSQSYMRYIELGGDPADLFTNPEIGNYVSLYCKSIRQYNGTYRPPREAKFKPTNEPQSYNTSSYTKILDMQVTHFGLRTKEQDSYKLDDTCRREIGFSKLDYSGVVDDVFRLPYVDFALTVEYNIRDVLLMPVLDLVLNDLQANLVKREITGTEFDNLFSSKQYVTNAFTQIYDGFGFIQRNDINSYITKMPREFYVKTGNDLILNMYDLIKSEEKMSGGFVSNPNKFKKMGKMFIDGIVNYKAHGFSLDMDAESQYPSAIIANRIGLESLLFKIVKKLYNGLNEAQIITKLINRDLVGIGELFGLPSLHSLTEQHYGIKTNYKIKEAVKPTSVFKFKDKEYAKFRTAIKKVFSDKLNDRDEDAGKFQMNNTCMMTKDGRAELGYLGSLVEYWVEDHEGEFFNLQNTLVDSDKSRDLFGSFEKDEFIVHEDPEILSFIKPKRGFTLGDKQLLLSDKLSLAEIEMIRNARNNTVEFRRGNYSLHLLRRNFVHNFDDDINLKIYTDGQKVFMMFSSSNNINISKGVNYKLHISQVFSIVLKEKVS